MKKVKTIPMILSCIFLLISSSNALFDWGSLTFAKDRTNQYLARFAVDQDAIFTAKARLKLSKAYSSSYNSKIEVLLMNDKEWDIALESQDWAQRSTLARFKLSVNLNGNGDWSNWEKTRISIKNRPQVWYIMLADCDMQTHPLKPDLPSIQYEIEMFNDDSHFSHEHWGQLPITLFTLILFCYLLVKTGIKLLNKVREENELESPLSFLALAIFLEFSHLSLLFVHLLVYWGNGIGFWWMEYLAPICEILSQASIVTLVLLISFGWTLTFNKLKEHKGYNKIITINLIIHFVIGVLTLVDNGEHHKYHDYEGFPGFLLVFIRFWIFGIFIWKITAMTKAMSKRHMGFIKGFSISSSLYLLSFPLFYFVSYILNPHMRLKFIVYGNLLVQMVAVIILVNQITKKGSKYDKASEISKEVLPNKFH